VRQKFEQFKERKVRIKRTPVRSGSHVWQDRNTFDLPPDKDSLAGAYMLREITTQNRLLYQESPRFVKKIGALVARQLCGPERQPISENSMFHGSFSPSEG